ncbi:MAG: TonB-dependent receptor, partial [Pseudomonadales bacterium]
FRIASPTSEAVDWVAGLFYWHSEYEQNNTLRDAICLGPAAVSVDSIQPCPAQATNFFRSGQSFMSSVNESYAGFGQINWRPTEGLELFAGLRLIKEDLKWSHFRPNAPAPGFPSDAVNTFGVPGGQDLPYRGAFDTDDTAWAGKFGGLYELRDNVRVFVSYSRGYKGPAANTNDFNFSEDAVDPEIVDSYEVGLRSELLDNKVNLNVTAYYTEIEDFQTQTIDQVSQAFNVSNVGVFETAGVEIELDAAVTDDLFVSAGLAYTDAVFDEFVGAQCYVGQTEAEGCTDGTQDLSGAEAPNSPDWKFNLLARYEFNLASWNAFVQGNYSWQDDVFFREDLNPASFQESYGLFDMAIGARSPDDRFQVSFFVENVLDEDFAANRFQIGLPPGNASFVQILSKNVDRYFGGSIRMNF